MLNDLINADQLMLLQELRPPPLPGRARRTGGVPEAGEGEAMNGGPPPAADPGG